MNYCAYLFTLFRRIYGTFLLFLHQKTYFMKKMMLYLGILIFLVGLGCHKDEVLKPVDNSCNEVKFASAGFMVAERHPNQISDWVLFDTDTITTPYLTLTANENTSKYEWEFGGNKTNTQSINVNIPPNSVSGDVFIFKLTVRKDWRGTCYVKGDTNPVSLIRKIVYLEDSSLIESSKFKGYCLGNPSDTFTMTFRTGYDPSTTFNQRLLYVTNLIRGQTGYAQIRYESYRQSLFDCGSFGFSGLNQASGFAILSKNDSLRFDFTHILDMNAAHYT
jgi:hypothetical protein